MLVHFGIFLRSLVVDLSEFLRVLVLASDALRSIDINGVTLSIITPRAFSTHLVASTSKQSHRKKRLGGSASAGERCDVHVLLAQVMLKEVTRLEGFHLVMRLDLTGLDVGELGNLQGLCRIWYAETGFQRSEGSEDYIL